MLLVVVAFSFSSDIMVSATVLLPPLCKKERAGRLVLMSWLLLLLEFLLPQDEIDEADEMEESEEDEEDDILPVFTAMDGLKSSLQLFVLIIDVVVAVAVVVDPNPAFIFIVVADGFDIATPNKKSNNSPKSVIGDH